MQFTAIGRRRIHLAELYSLFNILIFSLQEVRFALAHDVPLSPRIRNTPQLTVSRVSRIRAYEPTFADSSLTLPWTHSAQSPPDRCHLQTCYVVCRLQSAFPKPLICTIVRLQVLMLWCTNEATEVSPSAGNSPLSGPKRVLRAIKRGTQVSKTSGARLVA